MSSKHSTQMKFFLKIFYISHFITRCVRYGSMPSFWYTCLLLDFSKKKFSDNKHNNNFFADILAVGPRLKMWWFSSRGISGFEVFLSPYPHQFKSQWDNVSVPFNTDTPQNNPPFLIVKNVFSKTLKGISKSFCWVVRPL